MQGIYCCCIGIVKILKLWLKMIQFGEGLYLSDSTQTMKSLYWLPIFKVASSIYCQILLYLEIHNNKLSSYSTVAFAAIPFRCTYNLLEFMQLSVILDSFLLQIDICFKLPCNNSLIPASIFLKLCLHFTEVKTVGLSFVEVV